MKGRGWAVFGICLGMAIIALDWSIVSTALPAIQRYFHASTSQLQWIMAAFGVFSTTFMVTMGRLADDFGRKKFFFGGLALFGIGLIFSGCAVSTGMLIFGRCVQGLATAVVLPVSQSLVRLCYPPGQEGRGIGIWASVIGLFLALGPVVGGLLVSTVGWRWIFLVGVPVLVASLWISYYRLEESTNENGGKDLDWLGLIALIFMIGPLTMAIIEGPNWGWESPAVLWLFIIAAIGLIFLIVFERKVKSPIIDPEFFFHRNFVGSAIAASCVAFMAWVMFFILPLFLHNVADMSLMKVGLIMMLITLPVFFLGPLVAKWPSAEKWLIIFGLLCFAAAAALCLGVKPVGRFGLLVAALLTIGIGWGVMWGPSISIGVSAVNERLSGLAAGALMTIQDLGGVLGLAISGTLFRTVAGDRITTYIQDEHIPVPGSVVQEVAGAISNPHAIESMRDVLRFDLEERLPDAMRYAFMMGWDAAMWLLIALSLFAALSALILLRKRV